MFSDRPPLQRSYLLLLPLELRQQIYDYVLPSSTTLATKHARNAPTYHPDDHVSQQSAELPRPSSRSLRPRPAPSNRDDGEVVWRRGCTALFAVNRQIHDECVDRMYGTNTFVVSVRYDRILFKCRWLLPSGLTPGWDYSFLDHFSQRNLSRIRNYMVTVEKVDSYTGMVKFNCGGSGLTPGLKAQVDRLVDVMKLAPDIRFLHLKLKDGAQSRMSSARGQMYPIPPSNSPSRPQAVLDPFMRLRGLRQVIVDGSVTSDYAQRLEKLVTRSPMSDELSIGS